VGAGGWPVRARNTSSRLGCPSAKSATATLELRTATVPAEEQPVTFGVHGAVAEHYGTDPTDSEPHATTLDYLVAAAAGWLMGSGVPVDG
jgi:hypothetical protein